MKSLCETILKLMTFGNIVCCSYVMSKLKLKESLRRTSTAKQLQKSASCYFYFLDVDNELHASIAYLVSK